MKRWRLWLAAGVLIIGAATIAGWIVTAPNLRVATFRVSPDPNDIARGESLILAGACGSCHTPRDRPDLFLAGGPAMHTPFGVFHVPNITPDDETGIGRWSSQDFVRAMRNGVSPDGEHLYPIFPYRWYRDLSDADLLAMKAYLDSLPPVRRAVPEHELWFPLSIRRSVGVWKLLNMPNPPDSIDEGNLGKTLLEGLAHCGACHTPSLLFVYYSTSEPMAGDKTAIGAFAASNITSHAQGIGAWSDEDIVRVLAIGVRPDGTPVRGAMSEYVADSSSRLSDHQRRAIVRYLRTLAPIDEHIARTNIPAGGDVFQEHSLILSVTPSPNLTAGQRVAFSHGADACAQCHASAPSANAPLATTDLPFFPILRGQSAPYLRARLHRYAEGAHPVMSPIAPSSQ